VGALPTLVLVEVPLPRGIRRLTKAPGMGRWSTASPAQRLGLRVVPIGLRRLARRLTSAEWVRGVTQ
jgi:hypothetical protein